MIWNSSATLTPDKRAPRTDTPHQILFVPSLLSFLRFPLRFVYFLVSVKESTPSFASHSYNFFFLRRLEDADGGLVWFGVIIVWLVGWLVFSFPSIPFHQPLNFPHQWQPTSPVFNVPFQKDFVLIHL